MTNSHRDQLHAQAAAVHTLLTQEAEQRKAQDERVRRILGMLVTYTRSLAA